jgi:hypothetical protein
VSRSPLAALDVHHARLVDRCEQRTGIEPFGRLVEQVMGQEPYASARRIFWIVDNGSPHAGRASVERLERRWANLRLIHLPIHAAWLNQIELYLSIVQGADAERLRLARRARAAPARLRARHWRAVAEPFGWSFNAPRPRARAGEERRA